MKNEKCVKDESHSEFTKEEQEEFLNLLGPTVPHAESAPPAARPSGTTPTV